jgi:hypothetical protein
MNRICPTCEREIVASLYSLDGGNEAVDMAGEDYPEEGDTDYARADVNATVRLACSCSHYDVELDGSVSAFSWVPDEWEYEPEDGDSA